MTAYAGACQDLGFICDWRVTADRRSAAVDGLVDHLNEVHATGSTSPALSAVVDSHITETPAGTSGGAHTKEHAS